MSGLNCTNCGNLFDKENKLPLVLPCGDSICIECLISTNQSINKIYKCGECWRSFEVTNYFLKELPKNKAVLMLIGPNSGSYKSGPAPRILFSTPENRKISSPEKNYNYFTPTTYPSSFYLTSPNSVSIKCARRGCTNDRYYANGEVWEYCCINCRESDIYRY